MPGLDWAAVGVAGASLLAWSWLLLLRGRFWQIGPRLWTPGAPAGVPDGAWPGVAIVIPARDEAPVIGRTLPSRLAQDYPGPLRVYLVDDASADGTADAARRAAEGAYRDRLTVVEARPLPAGWTGKVWALAEGMRAAAPEPAGFFLLSDADITLAPQTVRALTARAVGEDLDVTSVMARLHARSWWERLLIPAFVYFFGKLYPFRWVGDPGRRTAAAAGGCMLVRRVALERSGGLERVAGELIDDCALARLIQRAGREDGGPGRLWLGFDEGVCSERAYGGPVPIWRMVARSAFVQLRCSPLNLAGTVAGMVFLYGVPPAAAVAGIATLAAGAPAASMSALAASGLAAWAVMAATYVPMLLWHSVSAAFAPVLPVTAILYTLMTLDSARRYWTGRGAGWKGRTYASPRSHAGRLNAAGPKG